MSRCCAICWAVCGLFIMPYCIMVARSLWFCWSCISCAGVGVAPSCGFAIPIARFVFISTACCCCCCCCCGVSIPRCGLAWAMRGVWAICCGRLMGVATCCMLGVACGCRGVPAGWLCWLPRDDMLTDMGTAMPWWFCTTDDGRGGLPPILEPDPVDCIDTPPTMGDDMF